MATLSEVLGVDPSQVEAELAGQGAIGRERTRKALAEHGDLAALSELDKIFSSDSDSAEVSKSNTFQYTPEPKPLTQEQVAEEQRLSQARADAEYKTRQDAWTSSVDEENSRKALLDIPNSESYYDLGKYQSDLAAWKATGKKSSTELAAEDELNSRRKRVEHIQGRSLTPEEADRILEYYNTPEKLDQLEKDMIATHEAVNKPPDTLLWEGGRNGSGDGWGGLGGFFGGVGDSLSSIASDPARLGMDLATFGTAELARPVVEGVANNDLVKEVASDPVRAALDAMTFGTYEAGRPIAANNNINPENAVVRGGSGFLIGGPAGAALGAGSSIAQDLRAGEAQQDMSLMDLLGNGALAALSAKAGATSGSSTTAGTPSATPPLANAAPGLLDALSKYLGVGTKVGQTPTVGTDPGIATSGGSLSSPLLSLLLQQYAGQNGTQGAAGATNGLLSGLMAGNTPTVNTGLPGLDVGGLLKDTGLGGILGGVTGSLGLGGLGDSLGLGNLGQYLGGLGSLFGLPSAGGANLPGATTTPPASTGTGIMDTLGSWLKSAGGSALSGLGGLGSAALGGVNSLGNSISGLLGGLTSGTSGGSSSGGNSAMQNIALLAGLGLAGKGLADSGATVQLDDILNGADKQTTAMIQGQLGANQGLRKAAEDQYLGQRATGRTTLDNLLGRDTDAMMAQAVQGRQEQLNRQGLLSGPSGAMDFALAQEASKLRQAQLPNQINYENQTQSGLESQRAAGLNESTGLGTAGMARNMDLYDQGRQLTLKQRLLDTESKNAKSNAMLKLGGMMTGYGLGGANGMEMGSKVASGLEDIFNPKTSASNMLQ